MNSNPFIYSSPGGVGPFNFAVFDVILPRDFSSTTPLFFYQMLPFPAYRGSSLTMFQRFWWRAVK